jgi:multidrug resistance efflux pump
LTIVISAELVVARSRGLAEAKLANCRPPRLREIAPAEAKVRNRAQHKDADVQLGALIEAFATPDLDVARAQVAEARSQVARVQVEIDRTTVTAPIGGRILQSNIRAGEYASAGHLAQPLLLMGATDPLNVRAEVDEQDAARVKPGARAIGSVRGDSARRYPMRFVCFEPYVIPKKNLTGDGAERVDTRVLQVIFALEKDAPVYPGQQMDVFIEAGGDR